MSLYIGLSALRASQVGLDITSHNVANAGTPGYHRQIAHLESLNNNLFRGRRIGSGVEISDLERVRQSVVESFLTETISDFERSNQSLTAQRQIESFLLPGDGSLQQSLESLFNDIRGLAGAPSDVTARDLAVESGVLVANRFRELVSSIESVRDGLRAQIDSELVALNTDIQRLGELNTEIISAQSLGGLPNELLDERDQTINSIAEKVNVSRIEFSDGSISLTFGNYSIQRTITGLDFSLNQNSITGEIAVAFDQGSQDLQVTGGRLAALVESYNDLIPSQLEQLDELAQSLIRNFDQVHATGIGNSGPFDRLVGNRGVDFPNATLNDSGIAFPVQSGRLYISIIDSVGNRTTESIQVDPATQSLTDIVAQLNSLSNLNASINAQTNQLQISSSPGFRFDFTGTQETIPDLTNFTGSTSPNFSGIYRGDDNSTLNFEVSGSGDVGISANLELLVRDENGDLIQTINIGNGYEAGSEIELADGVTVNFSAGTVVTGDTFSAELISNPDETGLLSALGVNSFFVGDSAATIDVDERIKNDSSEFAASQTGDTAESNKINQFIELSETRFLANERLTFNEFLIELTTQVGVNVRANERVSENLDALRQEYERQRAAVSGVDVNEEFVRLTQYQNSFEAAVRIIQTSEAVTDELFSIIR